MKQFRFLRLCATRSIALLMAALFAACSASPVPPRPTPTLIPILATPATEAPTAEEVASPLSIIDRELLGAEGVEAACDAPPEATFTCENIDSAPHLEVQITASTFARWSLRWQNAAPLTGDETIALRLSSSGNVSPNLYLATGDGMRIPVPLSQFGLAEGTHTLHIPLREVRNAEGKGLDFSGNSSATNGPSINGVEIVFEWADMQGTITLESVRIEQVWREAVVVSDATTTLADALQVPAGFRATAVAEGLQQITQIDFSETGEMFVTLQNGRVWRYRDNTGDGIYDERILYTVGTLDLVGLLYDPTDGGVWLGSRGQLLHTLDSDGNGVADRRTLRIDGLPWGRHQNNGMVWNPDPDPFTGEPGGSWIYFGLGSTDDLEIGGELNATVLRFPRDGQGSEDLEVVSEGNRNAYDVVWANLPVDLDDHDGPRAWQLFASENGPDFNDAPDEVNHIRWGHHYGFPEHFGPVHPAESDGDPYSGPVYPVTPHASADGMAYIDNPTWPVEYRTLYVALFGEVFNPIPVGHIVERIALRAETTPDGEVTYRGEPSPFVVGLDRPLPLVTAPNGNLWVGDYATGVVYEIAYAGE